MRSSKVKIQVVKEATNKRFYLTAYYESMGEADTIKFLSTLPLGKYVAATSAAYHHLSSSELMEDTIIREAKINGKVEGMAISAIGDRRLLYLYVSPAHRRKGIARKLARGMTSFCILSKESDGRDLLPEIALIYNICSIDNPVVWRGMGSTSGEGFINIFVSQKGEDYLADLSPTKGHFDLCCDQGAILKRALDMGELLTLRTLFKPSTITMPEDLHKKMMDAMNSLSPDEREALQLECQKAIDNHPLSKKLALISV